MKARTILSGILVVLFVLSGQLIYAQHRKHHKHHSHHKKVNPHYRYKALSKWGYAYKVAPRSSYVIPHAGLRYHYAGGIFYKPVGAKYVIARAPVGVRVHSIPARHTRVVVRGRTYYYYYGTFYVRSADNSQYVTVAPPVGATVDALPDGYQKVYIEDNTYYEFEGTYYKAYIDEYGEVWYEVVGQR